MLHKNMIETKGGFRTLDESELEAVSGGFDDYGNFGDGFSTFGYMTAQQFKEQLNIGDLKVRGLGDGLDQVRDWIDAIDNDYLDTLNQSEQSFYYTALIASGGNIWIAIAATEVRNALIASVSIENREAARQYWDQHNQELVRHVHGDQLSDHSVDNFRNLFGPAAGQNTPN